MGSQLESTDYGLRDYPVALKAGLEKKVGLEGDYFMLSVATADVSVWFNDSNESKFAAGDGIPVGYGRLTLKSDVDQNVIIRTGYTRGATPIVGKAINLSGVTVGLAVGANLGNNARITVAAGASAEVFPASVTRLGWVLMVPETAADGLRIGGPGVSATTAIPIPFGVRKINESISPRSAVHIYNGTANPVTFDRLEELP